jgi:hypothetical protein
MTWIEVSERAINKRGELNILPITRALTANPYTIIKPLKIFNARSRFGTSWSFRLLKKENEMRTLQRSIVPLPPRFAWRRVLCAKFTNDFKKRKTSPIRPCNLGKALKETHINTSGWHWSHVFRDSSAVKDLLKIVLKLQNFVFCLLMI